MLELWFDFSCPYAYLASRRAPNLARAAGITLDWKPMLLGGVFRGIGAGDGPMATLGPAKALHNTRDMHRWADIFGVPFRLPAAHPMRTVRALRTLLALPHSRWTAAIDALFAAYWQRGEDITRDDVIASALRGAGMTDSDIADALARADDDAIKAELRRRTDEAIALGVFGAPAWIFRRPQREPLLIWGQDRLPWVEAVLAGWDPDAGPPPGGARPFGGDVMAFRSPASLDFYYDVSSPYAYLALTQLTALAERTGVVPRMRPILLGALFRAIGQADVPLLAMPAAKRRYVGRELTWWSNWWGVAFSFPTKFPQRTLAAQRLAVICEAERGFEATVRLATALGRAMWAEHVDLEDDAAVRALLAAQGLPEAWLERTRDPEIKAALAANTAAAEHAGVFGVPTFVVHQPPHRVRGAARSGEAGASDGKLLIWGQDRLDLVVRALAGWRPEG